MLCIMFGEFEEAAARAIETGDQFQKTGTLVLSKKVVPPVIMLNPLQADHEHLLVEIGVQSPTTNAMMEQM